MSQMTVIFTSIGSEDSETIVPKSASHQKAAVNCSDEAVGTHPHFLAKIVSQMATSQKATLTGHGCWYDKL